MMSIGAPPPSVRLCHCRARRRRDRRRGRRCRRPRVGSGVGRAQRLRRCLGRWHRGRRLRTGARPRQLVGGHRGRVVFERRRRLAPRPGGRLRLVSRRRQRRGRPDRLHIPLPRAERRPPPRHARRRLGPLEQRRGDHPDDRRLRDRRRWPDDPGGAKADRGFTRRGRKTGGGRSKSRPSPQAPQAHESAPRRPPSKRKGPRPPHAPRRPDGESRRASWP